MENKKTIKALQLFVTGLTEESIVHRFQGQTFKAKGFAKLGKQNYLATLV